MESPAPRVLLIGWDAADWRLLDPLLAAGHLPHLAGLIAGGCRARLASIRPVLSPIVWTSIATGKRPHQHGIHGFAAPDAATGGVRPAGSDLRTAEALWNMLSRSGLRCQVTGWFAGHPAEKFRGVCVSDHFPRATSGSADSWPVPPGCVEPASFTDQLENLRIHPAELSPADLTFLLPWLSQPFSMTARDEALLGHLRTIVAETVSVHSAATWLMENEPWDFAAVYFRTLDECGHHFMPLRPPLMAGADPAEVARYGGVMDRAAMFLDAMLGRLLELAGPDATVMLVSDHGFQMDDARPDVAADAPENMAAWHHPIGIAALRGPGLRRSTELHGCSVLDVAPTILHRFGLPRGDDMDGHVWLHAWEEPPPVARVPSWETAATSSAAALAPDMDEEVLRHFAALGYVELPPEKSAAFHKADMEWRLNRAVALGDAGLAGAALDDVRKLHAENPGHARTDTLLAETLARAGCTEEAREAALDREAAHGPDAGTHLLLAALATSTGDTDEALRRAAAAAALLPLSARPHAERGRAFLRLRRWTDAEAAYREALRFDPLDPLILLGLARSLVRQNRNDEALQHALDAVGLRHDLPIAHFQMGAILSRSGDYPRAITAFETALALQPGLRPAHRYLARLYGKAGRIAEGGLHHLMAQVP